MCHVFVYIALIFLRFIIIYLKTSTNNLLLCVGYIIFSTIKLIIYILFLLLNVHDENVIFILFFFW